MYYTKDLWVVTKRFRKLEQVKYIACNILNYCLFLRLKHLKFMSFVNIYLKIISNSFSIPYKCKYYMKSDLSLLSS